MSETESIPQIDIDRLTNAAENLNAAMDDDATLLEKRRKLQERIATDEQNAVPTAQTERSQSPRQAVKEKWQNIDPMGIPGTKTNLETYGGVASAPKQEVDPATVVGSEAYYRANPSKAPQSWRDRNAGYLASAQAKRDKLNSGS